MTFKIIFWPFIWAVRISAGPEAANIAEKEMRSQRCEVISPIFTLADYLDNGADNSLPILPRETDCFSDILNILGDYAVFRVETVFEPFQELILFADFSKRGATSSFEQSSVITRIEIVNQETFRKCDARLLDLWELGIGE